MRRSRVHCAVQWLRSVILEAQRDFPVPIRHRALREYMSREVDGWGNRCSLPRRSCGRCNNAQEHRIRRESTHELFMFLGVGRVSTYPTPTRMTSSLRVSSNTHSQTEAKVQRFVERSPCHERIMKGRTMKGRTTKGRTMKDRTMKGYPGHDYRSPPKTTEVLKAQPTTSATINNHKQQVNIDEHEQTRWCSCPQQNGLCWRFP